MRKIVIIASTIVGGNAILIFSNSPILSLIQLAPRPLFTDALFASFDSQKSVSKQFYSKPDTDPQVSEKVLIVSRYRVNNK